MNKIYVLEYDLFNDTGTKVVEHRINYYTPEKRQEWLSDYFKRREAWYNTNVKSFVFVECDCETMVSLRDGMWIINYLSPTNES